jgi:hypothetical protein
MCEASVRYLSEKLNSKSKATLVRNRSAHNNHSCYNPLPGLHICPSNLKHWIGQLRGSDEKPAVSFRELRIADLSPATVTVDETFPSGVQMRIQGPFSLLL